MDELLTQIKLSDKHFVNADFFGISFADSFLYSVIFEDSILSDTSFAGSQLTNVTIQVTDKDRSSVTGADFYRAAIQVKTQVNFPPGGKDNAIFTKSDFSRAKIESAVSFRNTTFTESIFIQTTASQASFVNCIFINVQFSGRSDTLTANYCRCDFSGSIFDQSIINNVRFDYCNFDESSFKGAILKHVDFRDCTNLKPEMFDEVESIDYYTCKELQSCGCVVSLKRWK